MGARAPAAMLATISGSLALLVGLAVLLLPLLVTEMSRPRDALWGAVVLLLGLVLVTSAERLSGAPMLAVLCGGLLIGRLGGEVLQLRWRQLTPEEQQRLGSAERWRTGVSQLAAALAQLPAALGELGRGLGAVLNRPAPARQTKGSSATGKRWVRAEAGAGAKPAAAAADPPDSPAPGPEPAAPEPSPPQPAPAAAAPTGPGPAATSATPAAADPQPETVVVGSFAEVEALMAAEADGVTPGDPSPEPRSEAG